MDTQKQVTADWFMVHHKYWTQAVKEMKGASLLRVSELQRCAEEIIDLFGLEKARQGAWAYLFSDRLVVQQGVFKWNSSSSSFRKIADSYSNITPPTARGL